MITKVLRIFFAIIFWSWNALFLAVLAAGFIPIVFVDLVGDAVAGLARWSTVGWCAVLLFLPVFVSALGLFRLRKDPTALFIAFFGIEIPAMTLACVRIFGMADLHGAAGVAIASVMVGGVLLLAYLADVRRIPRPFIHAGLSVFVVGSIYMGAVLGFLTVPIFFEIIGDMARGITRSPSSLLMATIPVVWCGLTILSIVAAPIVTPFAAVRAFLRSHREQVDDMGQRSAIFIGAAPALLLMIVLASGWNQPHVDAFARLEKPPATDAERQALLDDEALLRAGLTDAYLARWRYVADNNNTGVKHAWNEFPEAFAQAMADIHTSIARPFIFDGQRHEARAKADQLYRDVFGEEIERTERLALQRALASNAFRDQRYAGFMNEGEERVWLAEQEVKVEEKNGYAVVEIKDTWMNQTAFDEEVLLSFSLPPDAAITGVWLGSDPAKDKAFKYVVAPRGAAQQVYNEQVRQQRDPALLEQVGPQQYRLRVFPVPPRPRAEGRMFGARAWHEMTTERPRMHVWVRYEALPAADGTVPFPKLAERRNGFWDSRTTRTPEADGDDDAWVQAPPVKIEVSPAIKAQVGDTCFALTSVTSPARASGAIDVVIDRSFAMKHHKDDLLRAIERLDGYGLKYILTSGSFRGEEPSVVEKLPDFIPFGATSPKEMLRQWAKLRTTTTSAVVVLAARGSFDIANDEPLDIPLDAPIFLVHFGGMPAGYDDATADALAKSGGTAVDAADMADALAQIDGRLLAAGRELVAADGCDGDGPRGVMSRLAVRKLDRGRDKDDASTLDALHKIALSGSVVTPYSSMIVLVDEAQRRRLAELEKQDDRFQREVEQHKEGPSSAFDVTGVPEPHEWALIVLGALMVLVVTSRRS